MAPTSPMERQPPPLVTWIGWGLFAAAIVVAVAFRVLDLPLKPLHSDEGVNGWYSLRLWWTGYYHYQASDYHGPMMYYVNLAVFWLLGASDTTLRLGAALTGALGVVALALYRRSLGVTGVAAAALLLAVMPIDVYFSRTVIHEVYLATGTLVALGAGLRWLRGGGAGGGGGYGSAVLAGVALAVMFANKETAILTVACLGGAAVGVWILWPWTRGGAEGAWSSPGRWGAFVDGRGRWRWRGPLVGFVCFAVVMVLFYSSFFTFFEGLKGIFTTYYHWAGYGVSGRNQKKDFLYWVQFWPYLWPALVVGVPEMVAGAIRRDRSSIFLSVWFLLTFVVYSVIPYKTPWCFINISLPLVVLAGAGVGRASRALGSLHGLAALAPLPIWLVLVALLAADSREQNFERYDDPKLPYVYVQTVREYMPMVDLLREIGVASGDASLLSVVAIDAKNPMRWYLYTDGWNRDNFRYYKGYPDEQKDWEKWRLAADIFVCRKRHAGRLARELGAGYEQKTYPNRPGREVTLFVPEDMMPR